MKYRALLSKSDMDKKTLFVRYQWIPDICLIPPDTSYPNPDLAILYHSEIKICHISSKLHFQNSMCISNSLCKTSVKYRRGKKFPSHKSDCLHNNKLRTSAMNKLSFVLTQQSLQIGHRIFHTELNTFSLHTPQLCFALFDYMTKN